jgi:hypothetical protein
MTIYSIRTSMGRELWWTTGRKRALEVAEQLTEAGDYVHSNGCVGHSGDKGLRAIDLPVSVYKTSVVAPRAHSLPRTSAESQSYIDGEG